MVVYGVLQRQPLSEAVGFIPVFAIGALIFGYVGFAIFVAPLYFILRVLRQWPTASIAAAAAIGAFAALVTPQITASNQTIALWNLRTLADNPSLWIDPSSLGGALTGIIFGFLARPGYHPRSD